MDNVEIDGLTEDEAGIIRNTLPVVLEKQNQISVVEQLLVLCPDVAETFSTMPDIAIQSAFLMNMYKRGVNLMCNQNHEEIFEIFERHPKYNIKIVHVERANECILNVLSNHLENEQEYDYGADHERIIIVWQKLQNNFIVLMTAAYNKQIETHVSDKKLAKYRQRVFRSITVKDIDDVMDAFKVISEDKAQSASLLARLLATETSILKVFHAHNIDVASQADVIFEMIAKVIKKLTNVDTLIPWLKALGTKHAEMDINPRTLTLMKPVLVRLFEESLGFHFTDELKQSWIRILSLVIGMMMEGCRNAGMDKTTQGSSVDDNGSGVHGSVPTENDIAVAQETWMKVQKVLDIAVTSFYKDLISSKVEIRNLFSKSNMEQQANKLVRAIGSTIALLSNLDELEPILEELGRRHVYYNVMPRHFKYLKVAWFRMLENALTLAFTAEVRCSWNKVWNYITSIMKSSLEDAYLLYSPPDPEKVKLKILINHIDRIETQDMSYWADIWYAAFTNSNPSQSAAFGAEALNNELKHKSGVYSARPSWNLTCLNAMEVEQLYREDDEIWCRKYKATDASNGKNEWYTRGNIRGTFSQPFDLHAFPIDTHTIRLKFALEIDESVATFDEETLNVRLMPFKLDMMGGTDWDLFTPSIDINRESAIKGGSASGKRYTHCIVHVPIARRWKHHIWDTFLPLLLIEIFAFSVYFCAVQPMAKRLGIIATLLLTLFTFKITISESMPPTPYPTLMDYWFHVAKLLLVLHVFASVVIVLLDDDVANMDLICGSINFVIFLISNGILCLKISRLLKKYPKKQEGYRALVEISKTAKMSMKQSMNTSMNVSMNTATSIDQ